MAGKTQYKNTWQKENVDRVNLTMPKGRKAIIQAHAEALGQSVNGFINSAIDQAMAQKGGKAVPEGREATSEGEKVYLEEGQEAAQNGVTAKED